LGDKSHHYCCLSEDGSVVNQGKIGSTRSAVEAFFSKLEPCQIVMEAGTQSPWISQVARQHKHRVVVGNPRKLRMIFTEEFKNDRRDAEQLARVGQYDFRLLRPIQHRSQRSQIDLSLLRSREALVSCRTALINRARGIVKSAGWRLPSCSAASFHRKAVSDVPEQLRSAVMPLVVAIGRLTGQIKDLDRQVERICQSRYPETERLRGIVGVGPLTSLAFVLTLDDPARFASGRSVGAYLGLVPRQDQSGKRERQLPITKAGDRYLRQLLVSCAHYILGPFGQECALRSWGERLASRGGRSGQKRAVVAVARKLAVVLYTLWATGREYEPFPTDSTRAA
jgi:transposase